MRLMQATAALVAAVLFCVTAPALAGPVCTPTYPRGYHVPHGTKKHPLDVCVNGDLQATWGHCVPHVSA
jgi:hypothetical protein